MRFTSQSDSAYVLKVRETFVSTWMLESASFMERGYESIVSLTTGMILMFLGFFMYIGGESRTISIGVMLAGALCEFLGFFLAYLAYKAASNPSTRLCEGPIVDTTVVERPWLATPGSLALG